MKEASSTDDVPKKRADHREVSAPSSSGLRVSHRKMEEREVIDVGALRMVGV